MENSVNTFAEAKLFFNPIRKIMEDLFNASNKYGLIPDVFVNPMVALNETSKFLSGSCEKGYKLEIIFCPKIVLNHIRSILSVCQPAAHRSEIDKFISIVHSPYLLLSITYQLLDVLLWFKIYVDSHNDIEINKANYKLV